MKPEDMAFLSLVGLEVFVVATSQLGFTMDTSTAVVFALGGNALVLFGLRGWEDE